MGKHIIHVQHDGRKASRLQQEVRGPQSLFQTRPRLRGELQRSLCRHPQPKQTPQFHARWADSGDRASFTSTQAQALPSRVMLRLTLPSGCYGQIDFIRAGVRLHFDPTVVFSVSSNPDSKLVHKLDALD